jgi:polyisoprenoid-binding protein YceI
MAKFINNLYAKDLKVALVSLLLVLSTPAAAGDDNLCKPFEDAQIDKSLINTMLQAADDGHLYRIKQGSSRMGFCVNSPLGVVEAEFKNFKGGLALKDTRQDGHALVTIEVDSLDTDSFVIENMLKSESFFDSEEYPEILFVSSGMEWIGEKRAVLKGDLTMHGVTKPVAFYVDLLEAKDGKGEEMLTVKATTTIQRSEFGMYTLSPVVDDRVSLCMSIDAERYQNQEPVVASVEE